MFKGFIVRFDADATRTITGWPAWLRAPLLVITTVGQPIFLVSIAVVVAATLITQPAAQPIVHALVAGLVAMGINSTLKHFIHRPRPDTLYVSKMYFKSSSFPSGHAFGSMVIFGLLGYVAGMYAAAPWGIAALGVSAVLIATIGISRIYLGAHYPTDVIAGWLFGGAVLWLIIGTINP
jgi:membrane-associated phospholipid phosphatase